MARLHEALGQPKQLEIKDPQDEQRAQRGIGEIQMAKPDVTLQPSKGIVTQAAAQIYSAYIAAGLVKKDKEAESLMKRAIREAIAIARTVDVSVQSDEELPVEREDEKGAQSPSID